MTIITYTDVARWMVQDTLLDGTEPVRIGRHMPTETNKPIGSSNIVIIPSLANNDTRSVMKYRARKAEK